eukprot:ctg_6972.g660
MGTRAVPAAARSPGAS